MNANVSENAISLKIATSELVQVVDGIPKVSHIRIAENTSNEKRAVKQLIENYQQEIEEFGVLTFKMSKPEELGWRPWKEYFLTEDQATFLMTLLRNNSVVVNFKKNLVKAFVKLKKDFKNKQDEWKITLPTRDNPKECLHQAINLAVQAGLWFYDKEKEFEKMKNILESQVHEIKELKANNNKYKALITNTSLLWQWEILLSMEEAGVQIGIYRNTIFRELRYRGMLNKDNSPRKWYELYFKQEKVKYKKKWTWNSYLQTFVTPEGLQFLKQVFA